MSVLLWILLVDAVLIATPIAVAMVAVTVAAAVTAVQDARGRGRMRRGLDELIRERR